MVLLLALAAGPAWALGPWSYPGRYGGWGWGGWGYSPGGLMAGMGAFARGEGTYFKDIQKAGERESKDLQEWNAALIRERRAQWAEFQRRQAAVRAGADAAAADRDVLDGTTLNTLLVQIMEFDPDCKRAAAAQAPVARDAVRDIPYEPATEAFTVCLDQLTGLDRWPSPLDAARFDADRRAVTAAVAAALDADRKGTVPPATLKDLRAKVATLRARFEKEADPADPGFADAEAFLKSLAGLAGMLESPRLKVFLDQLGAIERPTTVGDLIGFMNAFNLRFAPAGTDRQQAIYRQLVPVFQQVAQDIGKDLPPPPADAAFDRTARQVFRNFSWQDLDAHARTGEQP
jgi:hypothetical protein